jgi:hypothetical protein
MQPYSLYEPFRPIISFLSQSVLKSQHTNQGQWSFVHEEGLVFADYFYCTFLSEIS